MLLIALAITVAFIASWGASLGVARPRARLLVGARAADRDHAARALDRDALAGADHVGAGLAGRAAARRGRARRGRPVVTVAPARRCDVGDVVLVRPGGSVPADGRVVDGAADIDESMVTGESRTGPPRRRRPGRRRDRRHRLGAADRGHRRRRRHRAGRHPAAGGRGAELLVAGAAAGRHAPPAGCSGSRSARPSSPRSSGALLGQPDDAVDPHHHRAGHRLPARARPGDPAGGSIATERAARGGVLVKDRLALESMRTVDAVLFDKTGTLTRGEPTRHRGRPPTGARPTRCSRSPPPRSRDSEHPLARAIVARRRRARPGRARGRRTSPRPRPSG